MTKTIDNPGTDAKRLRILMTEGASLSARQTLYGLGTNYLIDVLDPDPLCQCRFSSLVRHWIRSPSFAKEPEKFLHFLADLIRDGKYDVILPTHEQVYLLSRFRHAFTQRVGLALPEFSSLELLQNKAHFKRLLDELGLPQPEATILRRRDELDRPWQFPFFLKLAHSTAGGGVFRIANREELDHRADALEKAGLLNDQSEFMAQQPARGVQATIQAVFNEGQVVGIHNFDARLLGVGGSSSARVSADHAIVREHVAKLGAHLNWHGALFLDYYFDHETGQPQYIEANPRIGETVNALLSGVNLPELLVRVSLGESPPPHPLGRNGVRTQSFMMILMDSALESRSRKALWKEISDYRHGRGLYHDSGDDLTRPKDDPLSLLPLMWTALRLLIWPGQAVGIVDKTVADYSLPELATETIKALPLDLLDGQN
jgi:predicted ATP-grasp superfamily ATP-dependent carboligase